MSRELYYECDARSFDSVVRRDIEVTDEDIKNLCEQMKEVAIANSKSNLQQSSVKDVTKNVLLSWGILKKDENKKIYPTNAYVYLTGQGGLRSMIQFVLRNIRMGCRLEGIYRQDIYELPPDSIRELIVNAVMNCSYIQDSNIQVAIYDDRLEITSPGGLLPGVTIDLMKEGFSKIRNRSLANAFAYMNLVEAWGSGIPKLMQAMQEYGLREPEFIDMEVAFRINLYRGQNEADYNFDMNGIGKSTDKVPINVQEKNIYDYIQKNNSITTAQAAECAGVKQRRAREILSKMVEKGLLKKCGASRSTVYLLNTESDSLL